MLHITSGDSVAGSLRLAKIGGEAQAWRDVLHEGPVPAGLSLNELSEVRASRRSAVDPLEVPESSV